MQLGSLSMCDGVALHEVDRQAASYFLRNPLATVFGADVHQSIFLIEDNILFHPLHLSGGAYL